MITLQSSRLRVSIAEPNEFPNQTHRFDRAGFITDVCLDDQFSFCASEPENLSHPCTGGRGLCCEFKSNAADECAVGEYFPKFGVGLIRKEDASDYVFHRKYRDLRPFDVSFSTNECSAEFTTAPMPCLGYGIQTVRRIEARDQTLTIQTTLTNTGERPIRLVEYCHNFLTVNGQPLSSAYKWESPQLNAPSANSALPIDAIAHGFRFRQTDQIAFAFRVDSLKPQALDWRLSNERAGASIRVREAFQPSGIQIWSSSHMICPEIFHQFVLNPAETHAWTRIYRFESNNRP